MKDYKPIQFKQLCMVVKTVLQRNPSIDDAEWKAKTQDVLAQMGFNAPNPEAMVRAMTQVEYALRKTIGPRLQRPIPRPQVPAFQPPLEERTQRTHQPAGWEIVQALMANLSEASTNSAPTSEPFSPPPARDALGITEDFALHEFWRQVREDADRMLLLRAYAELAIVRPAEWSQAAVRAEFRQMRFGNELCFVCLNGDKTHWHHIIQVQHGGSNYPRNFVCICERCHLNIHPWLVDTAKDRSVRGWTKVGDVDLSKYQPRKREIA